MRKKRYFQILTGSIFRKVQSYEREKIHSPWLRSSMRCRRLGCDRDGRARWFDGRGRNAWRRHGNARRYGNARRFHATFDGGNANASRSDDEFTLGHAILWRAKLQSK